MASLDVKKFIDDEAIEDHIEKEGSVTDSDGKEIQSPKAKGKRIVRAAKESPSALVKSEAFKSKMEKFGSTGAAVKAQQIITGETPAPVSSKEKAKMIGELSRMFGTYQVDEQIEIDQKKSKNRDAVIKEMKKSLLGYAKINFVTNNDLGRGPTIVRQHLNPRGIQKNGIKSLQQLYEQQSLHQNSTETRLHLRVLVRKSTIKTDSLIQSSESESYPHIQWADDIFTQIADNSEQRPLATVADGNHRVTFVQTTFQTLLDKYLDLKEKTKSVNAYDTYHMQIPRENLVKTEQQLEELCCWNCSIYDWDMIEKSKNKATIYVMLSENDVFFNQPDTQSDSLHHLLLTIAGKDFPTVRSVLQSHRQGRITKSTSLDSIFKDAEALMTYAKPYEFAALRTEKVWSPQPMFQWQSCATPILSPYLDYMTRFFQFLASNDDFIMNDQTDVEAVADTLFGSEDLEPWFADTLFDHEFFSILEKAYTEILQTALISFGRRDLDSVDLTKPIFAVNDEEESEGEQQNEDEDQDMADDEDVEISWTKVYPKYIQVLCTRLTTWVDSRCAMADEIKKPSEKIHVLGALEKLVPRIQFLHKHNFVKKYIPLAKITSPPPIYSALFYIDLAKSVADVSNGIAMVYNWFEPLTMCLFKHTKAKKTLVNEEGELEFDIPKPPHIFRNWLDQHIVRQGPVTSTKYTSEETEHQEMVDTIMAKITSCIIYHREGSLIWLNNYMKTEKEIWEEFKSIKYYKNREDYKKKRPSDIDEPVYMPFAVLALEIINCWHDAHIQFERAIEDPHFTHHYQSRVNGRSLPGTMYKPHTTNMPNEFRSISESDDDDDEEAEIRKVINLLSFTGYNWGEHPNKNDMFIKQARFVLSSLKTREAIYNSIFQSELQRKVFVAICNVMEKHLPEKLQKYIAIPKFENRKKKGNGEDDVPAVHEAIVYTETEQMEQDLIKGILKLVSIVKSHGTVGEVMTERVVRGFRELSMGFAEVSFWTSAPLDGQYPAKNGTIDLEILKAKVKSILPTFPEEGAGLQAVKAAKLLKAKNLANLTKQIADSRPSKSVSEDWDKAGKQKEKQQAIFQQSYEKDRLAQSRDVFHPSPTASPKTPVRKKAENVYQQRMEKNFVAGPSAPTKQARLFLSSPEESSESIPETARPSRKRNLSITATTAGKSKKAKKVRIADNSTAIDVADKLNTAMGQPLVQNSSDDANEAGEEIEQRMDVETPASVDEHPIQNIEESGSGEPIQIDVKPTNSTPEDTIMIVNQDDDAAPSTSTSSSDSGTGGITFGVN